MRYKNSVETSIYASALFPESCLYFLWQVFGLMDMPFKKRLLNTASQFSPVRYCVVRFQLPLRASSGISPDSLLRNR